MHLGIDPSTKATGFAVIDNEGKLIKHGVLNPAADMSFGELLKFKYDILDSLIKEHKIISIGCEDQFNGVNPDTFKKLSRVTGMVQLLAANNKLPLDLYIPASWRKVFHGDGKAKKKDTLLLVNQMYDLKLRVKDNDIADAIGIAYTKMVLVQEDNLNER